MDTESKRRIAIVEASLRNSNYRIAEVQEGREVLNDLFCECGRPSCRKRLSLPHADYERARANDLFFLIARGHELVESETIVETHDDWLMVEKTEEMRPTLDATDAPSGPEASSP